ncbi:hypothetical protein MAPG_06147 [Magnaporthiopsis poae ATCC 64411]|uniref:Heterokaryon incompatibility domain-containing protein n=1 Tax=Magnaporthiopsis poae (strain ATCC 64411 / 73-15) TaxID=644358 RepID=A0A0C4E193_MAGP6|nr:hypothetical protein MAPG_06147 [Magnaporthiopsis poae ATCC 64411]
MTDKDLNFKKDRARCFQIYGFADDEATRTTYADIRSVLNILDTSGGGGFAKDLAPSAWEYLHSRDDDIAWFYSVPEIVRRREHPRVRKILTVDIDELVFARKYGWYPIPGRSASPRGWLYLTRQQEPRFTLPPKRQSGPATGSTASAILPADLPEQAALSSTPAAGEVYSRLPDSSWFRLLIVDPGTLGDPITCRLVPVPRNGGKELRYDALSYVWDSRNVSGEHCFDGRVQNIHGHVVCNGVDIEVKANIWEALYCLRRRDEPCVLWADALCINQDDDGERAMQVAVMGQIYSAAARTLVWLGSRDGDTQGALDLVCSIVRAWDDRLPASYEMRDDTAESGLVVCGSGSAKDVGDLKQEDWALLAQLYQNKWFRRRWVIQEVVCSQSPEVVWGKCRIAWHWVGLCAAILRTQHTFPPDHPWSLPAAHGVYAAYLIFRLSRHSSPDGTPFTPSFLQLLRLTEQFDSSESLDQFFAILGIATRENQTGTAPFITPDYGMSEMQVCRLVAERFLASEDSELPLKFLSDAGDGWTGRYGRIWTRRKRADPAARGPCPSWVPRWSNRQNGMLGPWTIGDETRPERALPFQRYEAPSPDCLQVRGIQVSAIVWCSRPVFGYGLGQWLGSLFQRLFGAYEEDSTPGRIGLLARTLCAGRNAYGSRVKDGGLALARHFVAYMLKSFPADDDGEACTWWKSRQAQLGGDGEGSARDFEQISGPVCDGRSLFVTSGGHLGLCSMDARAGDSLCVLGGAVMPFILRPRSLCGNGDGDGGLDGFTVVGDCYVDGLMDDEAVEAMRRGESHRGPLDARKVMAEFYNFPRLDVQGRVEMATLIDKALELSDKKYERLEASRISLY